MVSAVRQLRVVTIWYALLGAWCSLIAVIHFQMLSAFRKQEADRAAYEASHHGFLNTGGIGNPVPSLLIFTGAAVVSWAMFVLSLRYLALSQRGQLAALVLSLLLALGSTLVAGVVTFRLSQAAVVWVVYWGIVGVVGIAGVCSLWSFFSLWRHRRASNNRWRGP
jgi:hypothetical protein